MLDRIYPQISREQIPDLGIVIGEGEFYEIYRPLSKNYPHLVAYISGLTHEALENPGYYAFERKKLKIAHKIILDQVLCKGSNYPITQDYFTLLRKQFFLTEVEILGVLTDESRELVGKWLNTKLKEGQSEIKLLPMPMTTPELIRFESALKKAWKEFSSRESVADNSSSDSNKFTNNDFLNFIRDTMT